MFICLLFFPQAPENNVRVIFETFLNIRRDIRKSRCTTGMSLTGGKFPPVSTTTAANLPPWFTLSYEYLREFSKKFDAALMKYSGVWGKLIHEKNLKSKSRDTVSLFKYILKGHNYPLWLTLWLRMNHFIFLNSQRLFWVRVKSR
jgi:hypothetical protein